MYIVENKYSYWQYTQQKSMLRIYHKKILCKIIYITRAFFNNLLYDCYLLSVLSPSIFSGSLSEITSGEDFLWAGNCSHGDDKSN